MIQDAAARVLDGLAAVSLALEKQFARAANDSGPKLFLASMTHTRTISGFFQHDHERLDALFQSFQSLKRQDFSKAQEAFAQFKAGLERHIRWEEDVLFPLWEEKTGMSDGGPTFVMRHEHRQIEEHLLAIGRNVTEQNTGNDQSEQALLALLGAHNLKEERVLYPAIDQVTTPEECGDILRTIQEVPKDRTESSAE